MKYFIILSTMAVMLASCARQNVFDEPPDNPVIDSIAPASGKTGTHIRLYGSGFSLYPSGNAVSINGIAVQVDSPATSTVLLATITDSTGTGTVMVKVNGRVGNGPVFTYLGGTSGPGPGPGPGPGNNITVTTLAGNGTEGFADGTGTAARFYQPHGVAVDPQGNVYVADMTNQRIRKVSAAGVVSTVAGSGRYGHVDGNGATASFGNPFAVAVDGRGNMYVADYSISRVRKISAAGVVSTLAGNDTMGLKDGVGVAAQLSTPTGIAVDAQGNVYVADAFNNRIRKINAAGVVTTIAGSGAVGIPGRGYADGPGITAKFSYPFGIAVDAQGYLYVGDMANYRIRKISPAGVVSTLAGSGVQGFADGDAATAQFSDPRGVALDAQGNIYVADGGNHRIRKITPAGMVSTVAGGSTHNYIDGNGVTARFFNPFGVAVDNQGVIYVADMDNHTIRKITIQ